MANIYYAIRAHLLSVLVLYLDLIPFGEMVSLESLKLEYFSLARL